MISKDIQTFPGTVEQANTASDAYVTVLYGYNKPDVTGYVNPDKRSFLDEFEGRGGVFKNIPRDRAEAWAKGLDKQGKPAKSRVFIQAILPNSATEEHFIAATGRTSIPQDRLAAYINASDAKTLIDTLGADRAKDLAERLSKELLKK